MVQPVMLAEQSTRFPRRGRQRSGRGLFHPIIAAVFVLFAYFGPDLLSQWENADGQVHFDVSNLDLLIFIVGILIFAGELVGIIVSAARFEIRRSIAHLLALLVLSFLSRSKP